MPWVAHICITPSSHSQCPSPNTSQKIQYLSSLAQFMHNEQENTKHHYYTSLVLYLVMLFSNADGRVYCTVLNTKQQQQEMKKKMMGTHKPLVKMSNVLAMTWSRHRLPLLSTTFMYNECKNHMICKFMDAHYWYNEAGRWSKQFSMS